MKRKIFYIVTFVLLLVVTITIASYHRRSSHQEMVGLIQQLINRNNSLENSFNPEAKYHLYDSLLNSNNDSPQEHMNYLFAKADLALKVGKEQESVDLYEQLADKIDYMSMPQLMPDLGIAYMRLGERSNCMLNHTGASCIFPIKEDGVHTIQTGSKQAIKAYQALLNYKPDDYESRWLLNIAYMTLGQYPRKVPAKYLIPI